MLVSKKDLAHGVKAAKRVFVATLMSDSVVYVRAYKNDLLQVLDDDALIEVNWHDNDLYIN